METITYTTAAGNVVSLVPTTGFGDIRGLRVESAGLPSGGGTVLGCLLDAWRDDMRDDPTCAAVRKAGCRGYLRSNTTTDFIVPVPDSVLDTVADYLGSRTRVGAPTTRPELTAEDVESYCRYKDRVAAEGFATEDDIARRVAL